MTKPRDTSTPNEEDASLFVREMAGVRPLSGRRPPAPDRDAPPPRPRPLAAPTPPTPPLREVESDADRWGFLAHDAGVGLLRELRAGRRLPAATLDLHGMTAAQAERALATFVIEAHQAGHRVILVVHGRGRRSGAEGPVLGDLVRARVVSSEMSARVLAFSQAPPALGGAGASLLLLRKR